MAEEAELGFELVLASHLRGTDVPIGLSCFAFWELGFGAFHRRSEVWSA